MNLKSAAPSMEEVTTPTPLNNSKNSNDSQILEYITSHLLGHNELSAATALFGDEYSLIFKALWYNLVSYQIRKSKLSVGRLKPDGRISCLYIINSGRGKGELKRVQKEYINFFNGKCREPTSLHAEQLVGKSAYNKIQKEYEERKGFLRADFLIIDEAFNLLSSKELHYSEARKYIRTALDPYPQNTICKQLTELGEDHVLEYEPECPINLFVQPLRFETDILILEGDIRRFIPVYVFMGNSDKVAALKRRVFDSYTDETSILKFCKEISCLEIFESFTMSSEAQKKFAKLSVYLVERGEYYSSKIANFMEMIAFTIQNNLLKFAAVQAFQHHRQVITIEDVELAFMDLFEIMEHTYSFVESKIPGSLDYGDGWNGARLKDQDVLKWLYEKKATSEEDSTISIQQYEDKIKETFNVKDRQARKYKNKHESRGWIKSKNAPNISKVWLTFTPDVSDASPASQVSPAPYHMYQKIAKNIESYSKPTPNGCAGDTSVAPVTNDNTQDDHETLADEDLQGIASNLNDPRAPDALNEIGLRQIQQKNSKKRIDPSKFTLMEKDILEFIDHGLTFQNISEISRKFVSQYSDYDEKPAKQKIAEFATKGVLTPTTEDGLILITINKSRFKSMDEVD